MAWCGASHCYVYPGPTLRTTNHETVPQLIEAGDVELLEALVKAGHMPQGLSEADELGLTPAYLAVTFDRPEVLRFLDDIGVDLAKPCDAVGYATPAFYCAYHGNVRCLETLARLGVDLKAPCTKYGELPFKFAGRHPPVVADQLVDAVTLRDRSAVVISSHVRGRPDRCFYMAAKRLVVTIQRRWRHIQQLRRSLDAPAPAPG